MTLTLLDVVHLGIGVEDTQLVPLLSNLVRLVVSLEAQVCQNVKYTVYIYTWMFTKVKCQILLHVDVYEGEMSNTLCTFTCRCLRR